MKRFTFVLVIVASFICASAFAQIKPCDELKGEIDAKLQANGVINYTLEIVPADQVKEQRVVGSCDGEKKKITYTKEKAKSGN
jgi:hypothetical protein